ESPYLRPWRAQTPLASIGPALASESYVEPMGYVAPASPLRQTDELSRLTFDAVGDTFRCTREELIRFGRKAPPGKTDELEALREGATQFKVDLPQLQDAYRKSDWAKANILIAISGTETDGTSGLRD